MASIISTLPDEVSDKIFALLCEDKQAIRASRLVCHWFKRLSSPYLITTVVFARRLKTIARLNEILYHEYFRQFVVELVCDASSYSVDYATDWHAYVQRCNAARQDFDGVEWMKRKREERAIWRQIYTSEDVHAKFRQSSSSRWKDDLKSEGSGDSCEPHDRIDHSPRLMFDNDDDGSDISELSAPDTSPEQAFDLGCCAGFPDNYSQYCAEKRIVEENITEKVLTRAFCQLKKLRRVVFSDYRSLARHGESYNDCTHRLFGNTTAPCLLSPFAEGAAAILQEIMRAFSNAPNACIEQFSTGCHVFEDESRGGATGPRNLDSRDVIYIPAHAAAGISKMASELRQLQLKLGFDTSQLMCKPGELGDMLRRMLLQASNLQSLSLAIQLPYTVRDGILKSSVDRGEMFEELLGHQRFPRLKALQLQGWKLPQVSIEMFLAAHATTLRTVHFIDCALIGDQVQVAHWAGRHLLLEGIQIRLIRPTSLMNLRSPLENAMVPEDALLWLAGRQNSVVQ